MIIDGVQRLRRDVVLYTGTVHRNNGKDDAYGFGPKTITNCVLDFFLSDRVDAQKV